MIAGGNNLFMLLNGTVYYFDERFHKIITYLTKLKNIKCTCQSNVVTCDRFPENDVTYKINILK